MTFRPRPCASASPAASKSRSGRRWHVAAFLVLAWTCVAAAQTSVSLRSAVSLTERRSVVLGDVARLIGPGAEALAATVVLAKADLPAEGQWTTLSSDAIRAALESRPDVNWGEITFAGASCDLRVGPAAPPASASSGPGPAAPGAGPTVAALLVERLALLHQVTPAEIRVRWVNTPAASQAFLDGPPPAGRRVEVQPGAAASSRVPLTVDVYHAGRLEATHAVSAEIQVRRAVLVAAITLDRDTPLTAEVVTSDTRWLAPAAEQPLAAGALAGAVARRRVPAGRVLTSADVQPPVVVERGEVVWVHVLSGNLVLKAKARALADARDGETVRLRMEGSKRIFTARMSGRGVAVVDGTELASTAAPAPGSGADPAGLPATPPDAASPGPAVAPAVAPALAPAALGIVGERRGTPSTRTSRTPQR